MRYGFNGQTVFFQTKTPSSQNFLITDGMKVGKAAREFKLFPIYRNGSVCTLPGFENGVWDIIHINGQEPAHARIFIFQIAACLGIAEMMDPVFLKRTKNKIQHIIKMNTDIVAMPPDFLMSPFHE